jgi:streptogramin lyase
MPTPSAPASGAVTLAGRVVGGQQPIGNASIFLYAAGSAGAGTGAVNLLSTPVNTSQYGDFDITGDYTCPSTTTQVYLVARGGNPGISASTNNVASVLMAALGDCSNLTPTSFVFVNEVTTVAAAWALSEFIGPNADIGASATNATGLRNAFLVANNLANTTNGLAGGASLPGGSTIEAAKLYTLANVISVCVNSTGGTACNPLFSAATAGGVTPANTLDAALSIVGHPSSQVGAVFAAATPAPPFQPALSSVPNDWTMSITYMGGGIASPTALAIDSTGSVWIANYFGGVASKLSAAGVPAAASGFADPSLNESYGLTVDPYDNVWIVNEQTNYAVNGGNGSLTKFDHLGNLLSGSGFANGGIYFPYAVASDSNGDIWVADNGKSQASLVDNNDNSLYSAPYTSAMLPLPNAVAIDASNNAWFAAQGAAVRVTPTGTISEYSCCLLPTGIAIDQQGAAWISDYSGSAVVQVSASGTVWQTLTRVGGVYYPESLAIDGAGAVWAVNYHGKSFSGFTSATGGASSAAISPASGFGLDAGLANPFGIAVDASGNVWVTNFAGNSVTQFVGVATPIRTPLVGPPAQP